MNPDDIQRGVRAKRHDRAEGDAPGIGRVARMPGTGLPKGERRTRRISDGGRGSRVREGRKSVITIWSILLLGMVLLVLGVAIWIWVVPNMRRGEDIAKSSPVESDRGARVNSKFPSPIEEEAIALVKRGLAIRDPAQVTDCYRPGSASSPQIVEYLQGLEGRDGAVSGYRWLGSMDPNGLSVDGVLVSFKGTDGKSRNRVALLTPDAVGTWRIDFDAFARTVVPSWSEILENRAPAATVRIYLVADSYFNGPFADDQQWACYGIASPDTPEILLGYCKVGSPQAAALEWMVSRRSKLNRATLEIRRVDGAEPRQFEISQVLAEDWVLDTVAFDQRFK
jgi:hypothetical protein